MRIFKRGKTYWFELVYKGQRIQESTRVKNRRDAEDIAMAHRTALAKGEVGITERKKVPAFGEAMRDFLKWTAQENQTSVGTAVRYRYSSIPLLKFFKNVSLDRITPQEVERFKSSRAVEMATVRGRVNEKRKSTGVRVRPATVNRELACLRAMFNHTAKDHSELRNPVSQVKFLAEANQQERVLTFAEQRSYLAAASPTLAAAAGLILETGMRPEEVFTLQVPAVRLGDRFLKIERGKTPAARRRIDLSDTALAILKARMALAAELKSAYLFPCERDIERPLPGIQTAHAKALADSGVAAFRPYDMRHTWATRAAEAGIDLVTLASMLGHSRIQMVMRYAHPSQAHRISAMEKLVLHNAAREKAERRTTAKPSRMNRKAATRS
jgi:integrase